MKEEKKLGFSIYVPLIFHEVVECNNDNWVFKVPFNILQKILVGVAERSSQLNDPILNSYMCRMGLYGIADPKSSEYDPGLATKLKELTYE